MSYIIIIPARFASSRFPGKPLAILGDKPVLQHVYERASQSRASQVIIATDDQRIEAAAVAMGAEVCMTAPEHQSGTERLAEVAGRYQFSEDQVIVNVQGDEPFMPVKCMDQVADLLGDNEASGMSTLCHVIDKQEEIDNPHFVKVVMDEQGHAIYFSRAPIPFDRDGEEQGIRESVYYRHIGLYAYTAGFLKSYTKMEPCMLEKIEALEQLRVLWHGEKIAVGVTSSETGMGIDTPEDLERANKLLEK